MKSYKLILDLIKHPFREVVFCGVYKITHTKYNRYLKQYTLESLTDEYVESDRAKEAYPSAHEGNTKSE